MEDILQSFIGSMLAHGVIWTVTRNHLETTKSFFRALLGKQHSESVKRRTVSEFWALELEPEKLRSGPVGSTQGVGYLISGRGALVGVEIEEALLSPYGPLIAAHPLCRPAYSPQGWDLIEDLSVRTNPDYDVLDNILYADRVVRLAPHNKVYYAGLYDYYYGTSNVGLPLLIEESVLKKHADVLQLWEIGSHPGGLPVKVKGNLLEVGSQYSKEKFIPEKYRGLPSYGLEVTQIQILRRPTGVTHVAAPIDWRYHKQELELAHYFNVQDPYQFDYAESELDKERNRHPKTLLFDYDEPAAWRRRKVPRYNDMLRGWFEKEV